MRDKEWKSVKLKSTLGQTWRVDVQKEDSNGFHYFGEGWKDFVVAHNLCFGYFLLFRYEGDMVFFVTVFDHSECNKWYAPVFGQNQNISVKDEVVDAQNLELPHKSNGISI